jgi:pimeloyl-ACP methyl ester carboxylesterase
MSTASLDPSTCKQIRLNDGRLLAYAEFGSPQGRPLIFFHMTPGSRLFHHPDESIALSLGAHIIAPDRPGFGLSDFKPKRTLLDWPDDVAQLADALNLDKFAVAGLSGGGPYVAACALKIPHRLTGAALISSMAPLSSPHATKGMMWRNRLLFSLARDSRMLNKFSWWLISLAYNQNPDRFFTVEATLASPSEAKLINRADIKSLLIQDYAEAVRAGTSGIRWEMAMLANPWGFRLQDIDMEIHLWHGEQDVRTPITMGRYLANTIPNCRATFLAAEGHDLFFQHWRDILSTLITAEVGEDASIEVDKKPRKRLRRRPLLSEPEGSAAPAESRPRRRRAKPASEAAPRRRTRPAAAGSKGRSKGAAKEAHASHTAS